MTVNLNWPLTSCQVAFNAGFATNTTPTWTDLSTRLWSFGCDRGRQYELDQTQAGEGGVVFGDKDEALNPANTASPYYPNVLPYRQILIQAMWPPAPVGSAVNLLNASAQSPGPYDPGFESYANGATPSWVSAIGGTAPAVTNALAHSGSMSLSWTVVNGATSQGASYQAACIPGQQYTDSVYLRQTSGSSQQIGVLGGTTGSLTTSTGTWVRLTVTYTATQPLHTIQVATLGTAVAGTVYLDDVQHETGATANTYTNTGPVIYGVHRGYVERWPSTWNHQGMYGYAQLTTVDAFAALAARKLHTSLAGSILAKSPDYYWRLNEASTATAFADCSGNNAPPLTRLDSKYGPASTFGPGTAMDIAGDPSGTGVADSVTVNNDTCSILQAGATTSGAPVLIGGATSTYAATCALVFSHTTLTLGGTPMYISEPTGQYYLNFLAFVGPPKQIMFTVSFSAGGGISAQAAANDVWADGKPHLYVGVAQVSAGTLTAALYVDGTLQATATHSTAGAATTVMSKSAQAGGQISLLNGFSSSGADGGVYAHFALWNRALSGTEVTDLGSALLGYPGESSGTRLARYLVFGRYIGTSSIDAGQSLMGVDVLGEGTALLDACQAVTVSEYGNFWSDSQGTLTFTSRTRRYLATTVRWVFGEDQAGGEHPYEGDIAYDYDATLVYNDVTVENAGGAKPEVSDADSQDAYGPRSYQRSVNLQSDNEATDAANWILTTHKDPHQRIATLTLKPSSNPNLWPVALGVEIGDRVTVTRRTTAGLTMSADYFVEQISHSQKPDEWTVSIQASPASLWPTPWVLGDSTYGVLDVTTKLGY